MISAMPAVALRKQRVKCVPPWKPNGKALQPPALVEYYNNKISRLGSFPPSRRTYSTSTSLQSPDADSTFPYDEYDDAGRCRRCCRKLTLFHLGCGFLAGGLIILFVSVGSIRGDVMPLRAAGSSLVAFGALLCLIWTVCCRRPEQILVGVRSTDSFMCRQPTSGMESSQENALSPMATIVDEDDAVFAANDEPMQVNGGVVMTSANISDITPVDPEETHDLLKSIEIKC